MSRNIRYAILFLSLVNFSCGLSQQAIKEKNYRIKEITLCIKDKKIQKKDSLGNIRSFLQYQVGDIINFKREWTCLNEEVEKFNYVEGYYYVVKLRRVWPDKKNPKNYSLELSEIVKKEKNPYYINPVATILSTEKNTYRIGETIKLKFTVRNNSENDFLFLSWGTPLDEILTSDCLKVKINNKPIDYTGLLVKRMPPEPEDYKRLLPSTQMSAVLNLIDGYVPKEKGELKIYFKDNFNGLPESNTITINIM
ncbi:MAG: hypothetical protein N4A49_00220 [Marinifilaceae bacterium]|jgi:uncharacterized protein YkvS|nr:hypothetical protein [Marinifilaceae bacterium]